MGTGEETAEWGGARSSDVVIACDANNSITLHDVAMADLHASDFHFV